MFKKIASAGLGIALLASPLISSADTLSDMQAQIQVLLAQLASMQGQSQPVTPTSSLQADDYGTGTSAGNFCPGLSITMQRGSRDATTGGQVSELQAFLTDYYNLDDGTVNGGFFGKLTQKYLIQFQSEHGLPAFGIAGQLTRAKIASVCGGQTPQPSGGITVTVPNGGEQWEIGQLNTVTWAPYGYNPDVNPAKDVSVYLFRPGLSSAGRIMDTGKASLHTYFNINDYNTWAEPGQYYVHVVNNATGAEDRSDALFTLLPRGVDIKVNGSDGPVTLTDNQRVTVSISTGANFTNCTLSGIRANPGGNPGITRGQAVAGGSSTSEGYAYAPTPGSSTAIYIECKKSDGSTRGDSVQVNMAGIASSVQVTSPNGGESIPLNQLHRIQWSQAGLKTASVALYKNDQWFMWLEKDMNTQGGDGKNGIEWIPSYGLLGANSDSEVPSLGKVFKIYITGQKADGTGYVDDKSDAPFSFSSSSSSAGSLTVSTDASSPSHQVVAGGSLGVTLGVLKFRPTGEGFALQKVTLRLTSGKPSDLSQVYLYDSSGVLRGTAVFTGNNTTAVSTLSSPISFTKDTDNQILVKGDISGIGTAKPGEPGDLIAVNFGGAQGYGISSGATITGTGSTNVAGVRIFKSYPTVALVPLPSSGLEDGRLLRFSVMAKHDGPISIGKFVIAWSSSDTTAPNALDVYAYTDSSFSSPVAGGPHLGGTSQVSGALWLLLNSPLEIPAGATRYFEVRGNVTALGSGSAFTTRLLGDSANTVSVEYGTTLMQKDAMFVWSPNDFKSSQFSDNDWTNGYGISGLPAHGISQTRTGGAVVTPTTARGTYKGYLNGNLFITTENISQADALTNCKLNAANNQTSAIRCTWNDTEIYSAAGVAPSEKVDLKGNNSDGPLALAVGDRVNWAWTSNSASSCTFSHTGPSTGSMTVSANGGFLSDQLTSINIGTYVVTLQCGTASDSLTFTVSSASKTSVVKTFTSSGTWVVPADVTSVDVLVVGGGGGGGSNRGGGGGGGGVISKSSYAVTPGASISVVVGAGGAGGLCGACGGGGYGGPAANGGNSQFGTLVALGGGKGGSAGAGAPATGGSGGGGQGDSAAGASGITGQGNAGGNGDMTNTSIRPAGGGGGAGAAGENASSSVAGNGGAGMSSSISGSSVTYGGGGGGGSLSCGTAGSGGSGGGAAGSCTDSGQNATENTGGGGGGGGGSNYGNGGGSGGSGIVIISYTSSTVAASSGNKNLANALTALESALKSLIARLGR
jgi:hypothetical protein